MAIQNASSWNSYQRVVSSKCTFTLTTCSLAPSYLFLLWAQVIEEGIEKKVSQQLLLLLDSSWCSYWSIRCLCILCAVIWYYPMKKRDDKMMKDCKLPGRCEIIWSVLITSLAILLAIRECWHWVCVKIKPRRTWRLLHCHSCRGFNQWIRKGNRHWRTCNINWKFRLSSLHAHCIQSFSPLLWFLHLIW